MRTPKEFAKKVYELAIHPWDEGDSIAIECASFLKDLDLTQDADESIERDKENKELKEMLKSITTELYASGHHPKDGEVSRIIRKAVAMYS
jgi:hypothetical protein